jgi:hypothetical protein
VNPQGGTQVAGTGTQVEVLGSTDGVLSVQVR